MRAPDRKIIALGIALCCAVSAGDGADLGYESILERVSACDIDPALYGDLWPRQDAALLSLPIAGAVKGILLTQFYWAPGRNGRTGDYGIVFNAPVAHVGSTFPQYLSVRLVNGFQRRLLPLAAETNNPRNRSQTLLLCRGGTLA